MIARRAVRTLSFLFGLSFAGATLAATPALVVDVDSGRVLYAERATDPWFPASITKLMTTYVALSMVRDGKASLDQLLTLSPEAASEPPSKMGFKPGTQLTLDNALKIIMVKSANDISAMIAENLGGSVEGFAALMNEHAQRIGMRESVWVNPHGLPDPRQHTSARDMAILGRAILRDFPDSKDLFSISAIKFGRRVMANHNGLLGRYDGVDGMKTGFICSGGFNVVASATRGGRRLITVVMGSTKAKERTLRAADLFDRGFASSGWSGQRLEELPASNVIAAPDMRPVVCGRAVPAEEDAEPVQASAGNSGNAENAGSTAFSSQALGFAASSAPGAGWQTRELPPRAPLQPMLVWIGRDPAGTAVAAEDKGEPVEALKPRVAKAKPEPKVAAKPEPKVAAKPEPKVAVKAEPKPAKIAAKVAPKVAAKPAAPAAKRSGPAQAYASTETPPVIAGGKVKAKPVDPAETLKVKPAAKKVEPNKAETKKADTKTAEAKKPAKPAAKKAKSDE
ncbi:MAG TPA: serine hydrolase [Beijerinckiaceae bacterium]|jgi:D-alanyl-D-alanine carboxypeptidase